MGTSYQKAFKQSRKLIINNGTSPMNMKLQELTEKGGSGIALFFMFLKYATITYGFMTCVVIWSIIILAMGDGLKKSKEISIFDYNAYMAMVSIGNLKKYDGEDQDRFSNDMDSLLIVDFIITIIFFIFYLWFLQHSKKMKRTRKLLPSQFAIEASGFPSTVLDANEIKDYFEVQGLQVSECYLARNYSNTLLYYQELIDIYRQLQDAKELQKEKQKSKLYCLALKFPNLFDDVYKLDKKYKSRQKHIMQKVKKAIDQDKVILHDQYKSVQAYVVFRFQKDKVQANKSYQKSKTSFTNLKKISSNQKFQGKHHIKIQKRVDEPSGIRWENIEISNLNRFIKSQFVAIFLLGFLIICFAIIILVNLFKPQITTDLCNKDQWDSSQITWYVFYPEIHDEDCQKAFTNCFTSLFISFIIGIFVLGVNTMLKMIIKRFSKFMRYSSISQEIKASTFQIFRAQFVNTGLLIAILQFDFGGFKIPQIIVDMVKQFGVSNTNPVTYVSDFTRDFYVDVGGKIVLTTMILIVSPILFALLGVPLMNGQKRRKAKKKKIQREMEQALIPSEFDLATGYAVALNTIFISMFYCSGIPLLIPIAFLALFCQYWSLKYRVLRFNKKPPALDGSLNKKVLNLLPYAMFLHLIMGLFIFGQTEIISQPNKGRINNQVLILMETIGYSYKGDQSFFSQKITHNFSYSFFVIAMIILYLFFTYIYKLLRKIFKCIQEKRNLNNELISKSYEESYQKMDQYNIASYDIRKNGRYQFLVQAIDQSTEFDDDMDEEQRQKLEEQQLAALLKQQEQVLKQEEKKQYKAQKFESIPKSENRNGQYNDNELQTEEDEEEEEEEDEENLEDQSDYQPSENSQDGIIQREKTDEEGYVIDADGNKEKIKEYIDEEGRVIKQLDTKITLADGTVVNRVSKFAEETLKMNRQEYQVSNKLDTINKNTFKNLELKQNQEKNIDLNGQMQEQDSQQNLDMSNQQYQQKKNNQISKINVETVSMNRQERRGSHQVANSKKFDLNLKNQSQTPINRNISKFNNDNSKNFESVQQSDRNEANPLIIKINQAQNNQNSGQNSQNTSKNLKIHIDDQLSEQQFSQEDEILYKNNSNSNRRGSTQSQQQLLSNQGLRTPQNNKMKPLTPSNFGKVISKKRNSQLSQFSGFLNEDNKSQQNQNNQLQIPKLNLQDDQQDSGNNNSRRSSKFGNFDLSNKNSDSERTNKNFIVQQRKNKNQNNNKISPFDQDQ